MISHHDMTDTTFMVVCMYGVETHVVMKLIWPALSRQLLAVTFQSLAMKSGVEITSQITPEKMVCQSKGGAWRSVHSF